MANDNRRFALRPLHHSNQNYSVKGEIMVDEEGNIWYKNNNGAVVSATNKISKQLEQLVGTNDPLSQYLAFYNNRNIYRLFFDDNHARLDKFLELPESFKLYTISSIYGTIMSSGAASVSTEISTKTTLKDGSPYYVEFRDANQKLISKIVFYACRAEKIIFADNTDEGNDRVPVALRITTLTDSTDIIVGTVESDIGISIYVDYSDGSSRIISKDAAYMDAGWDGDFDTSTPGTRLTYHARYYYNNLDQREMENNNFQTASGAIYIEANKDFTVVEESYEKLIDIIVSPHIVYVNNDYSFQLRVYGYYNAFNDQAGNFKDITNKVIVDDNSFNSMRLGLQDIIIYARKNSTSKYTFHYSIDTYKDVENNIYIASSSSMLNYADSRNHNIRDINVTYNNSSITLVNKSGENLGISNDLNFVYQVFKEIPIQGNTRGEYELISISDLGNIVGNKASSTGLNGTNVARTDLVIHTDTNGVSYEEAATAKPSNVIVKLYTTDNLNNKELYAVFVTTAYFSEFNTNNSNITNG